MLHRTANVEQFWFVVRVTKDFKIRRFVNLNLERSEKPIKESKNRWLTSGSRLTTASGLTSSASAIDEKASSTDLLALAFLTYMDRRWLR